MIFFERQTVSHVTCAVFVGSCERNDFHLSLELMTILVTKKESVKRMENKSLFSAFKNRFLYQTGESQLRGKGRFVTELSMKGSRRNDTVNAHM